MRITDFDFFWTLDGKGYLITYNPDKKKYLLYTVKENIVKDLLGELDVDFQFLYTKKCLEYKDYIEFKNYMKYLKDTIVNDLGDLSSDKIYKSKENVFYKYVNNRSVELYNPIKMRDRAEDMWNKWLEDLRRQKDENTNPK